MSAIDSKSVIEPKETIYDIKSRFDWQSKAATRRHKFARLIAVSHYATFYLGRTFPNAVPLTYVIGYPKSGTTWAAQLLSDCLNLPFSEDSIFPIGCPAVWQGHVTWSPRNKRAVYVMRDGRDALVSLYFHLRGKQRPADHDKEEMTRFIAQQLKHPSATRANWGDHVLGFLNCPARHAPCLRYEDMLERPVETLSEALLTLTGIEWDPDVIKRATERYSFSQLSGRKRGQEDRGSYLRKGVSGDWRNSFTRNTAEIFAKHCGDALIAAGYESDNSWIDALPE